MFYVCCFQPPMIEKEVNFFFSFYFFSSPSSVISHVCFLESRVCLSQRMVEAEEYLSIHAEQ